MYSLRVRGADKQLRRDGLDLIEDLRVHTVAAKARRGQHLAANPRGVLDGEPQTRAGAHAVADDVGLLDAEIVQESGAIVSHRLVADGTVDIGGPAVTLRVDGDDLPVGSQSRQ